jgi:hypothetical protein
MLIRMTVAYFWRWWHAVETIAVNLQSGHLILTVHFFPSLEYESASVHMRIKAV